MRLAPLAVPLACLALGACDPAGSASGGGYAGSEGSASAAAISTADCGAETWQHLVGGPVALAMEQSYGVPWRFIGPDGFITKDYNPHRLTVTSTDGDTVGRIICS